MRRRCGLFALILIAALLAACGRPAPEQAVAPTVSPAPPAAIPAPADAQAVTTADGLPQGRTAEGYPLLGDPAAPVTLTMYSDFL